MDGKLQFLDFADLLDPVTGKSRVRIVDTNKPSYKIAREYMIRLEREDLEDQRQVKNVGAGDIESEQDLQA